MIQLNLLQLKGMKFLRLQIPATLLLEFRRPWSLKKKLACQLVLGGNFSKKFAQ